MSFSSINILSSWHVFLYRPLYNITWRFFSVVGNKSDKYVEVWCIASSSWRAVFSFSACWSRRTVSLLSFSKLVVPLKCQVGHHQIMFVIVKVMLLSRTLNHCFALQVLLSQKASYSFLGVKSREGTNIIILSVALFIVRGWKFFPVFVAVFARISQNRSRQVRNSKIAEQVWNLRQPNTVKENVWFTTGEWLSGKHAPVLAGGGGFDSCTHQLPLSLKPVHWFRGYGDK